MCARPGFKQPTELLLSLVPSPLQGDRAGEQLPGIQCVGMIGPEDPGPRVEYIAKLAFGLPVVSPRGQRVGDLVPGGERALMLRPENSGPAVEYVAEFSFGLLVLPLLG